MHRLVELLEEKMPDVRDEFNDGCSNKQIHKLEKVTGFQMPEAFIQLYSEINGESDYIGSILGFGLMSIDSIISNYNDLLDSAYRILSDQIDMVKEGDYQKGWIPFAEDGSGSYLVIDMDPGKKGKKGQIITIDRDNDYSYVLADSLDNLWVKIEQFLTEGKFTVNEEDPYFEWKSGHLFDSIESFYEDGSEDEMIPIDPYFERFFEGKIENHCISRKILEAKKQLFLSFNSDVEYNSISLEILKFMTNLKELTVYITKFHDFSPVAALKNLRTIRMGGEAFSSKDLNYLTGLEYLQEVWFSSINLNSIAVLKECKNIKKMHIYNSKMDDFSEIGEFSNLTELSFDSIECNDFSFLNSLKKMKKLEFAQISLNNLNFLEYMNKLVEFSADKNADDESSLNWIGKCSKLKRLGYPMGDIRMILNCKDLVSISIDAKQYKNLELLEQTEISSIHILNADSKEEANAIIEKAEKYADITASGYNVNWED